MRVRSPGVDRVLAAATAATGLDRTILLLGFVLGVALAFADGRRIDIFAYPLLGLVLWNLIVLRHSHSQGIPGCRHRGAP